MLKLNFTAASDRGLVRQNNEDSAYAGPHLLVLADGMGGHAAGEVASQLMVKHLEHLNKDPEDNDMLALLGAAGDDANGAIKAHVAEHPETEGMGTTLTALMFNGREFGVAHVGDSRGYRLRDGKLEQITKDDTFVQSLVDEGKLDPEDVSSHPQKSLILKAYTGRPVEPALYMLDARPGDKILLCSDGLSDPVTASTIEAAMGYGTVQEIAQRLIELALRSGGPDNVTIVLAEVVDADAQVATPSAAAGAAEGSENPQASAIPTEPVIAGALAGEQPEPTHPDSAASRAAAFYRGPGAAGAGAGTATGAGASVGAGQADGGQGKARPQQVVPAASGSAAGGSAGGPAGGSAGAQNTVELPREGAPAAAGLVSEPPKKKRGLKAAIALMTVAVLALFGLWGGKAWMNNQYHVFVAEAAEGDPNVHEITIHKGIHLDFLGADTHEAYQHVCINAAGDVQLSPAQCTGDYLPFKLEDLPDSERAAVSHIAAGDYGTVQAELSRLSEKALPACRPANTSADDKKDATANGKEPRESARAAASETSSARETSAARETTSARETSSARATGTATSARETSSARASGSAAEKTSAARTGFRDNPGVDCREVK